MPYKDPTKRKEYLKKYRQTHKKETEEYHQAHKEELAESHKQWYEANKKKLKEYDRLRYETNKDKIKEQKRKYREGIKDELKEKARQYRESYPDKIKESGRRYRETHKDKLKKYRELHRAQRKEYYKHYRKTHMNKIKEKEIKYYYGMTIMQFNNMLKQQSYKCAICGKKINEQTACVDHSHITGSIRGLLCNSCNVQLGFYEKMKNRENELQEYISAHKYNIKYYRGVSSNKKKILPIFLEQDKKCSICNCDLTVIKPYIDHDHETGFIRGILCNSCNTGIGIYERSLKYKPMIENYLEKGKQYIN